MENNTKNKVLKAINDFYKGKWGYYIKPIDNDTNMVMYIYDNNGIKEINFKEWMKTMNLDPNKINFKVVIDHYKKIELIKEI